MESAWDLNFNIYPKRYQMEKIKMGKADDIKESSEADDIKESSKADDIKKALNQ